MCPRTNPRCRMAAIFQKNSWYYICNILTDDEIWEMMHLLSRSHGPKQPIKFWKFKNPKWRRRPSWTRNPAVAWTADHTGPVVKLTLTLTLTGHNLAKTDIFPLMGQLRGKMRHIEPFFCTLKTTSGFNSDRTVRQYAHGLLLESPFVPSSADRWAVRAKIRQKRPSQWP